MRPKSATVKSKFMRRSIDIKRDSIVQKEKNAAAGTLRNSFDRNSS